jgi:hypothetical protein
VQKRHIEQLIAFSKQGTERNQIWRYGAMGNGNGQRTQLAETTTTKTKRLEGGSKHQAKQTANRAADQVHQVKSEDPVKKQAKSQEQRAAKSN